jgi:N,N'-diacetylchitobiose transport system permease protein
MAHSSQATLDRGGRGNASAPAGGVPKKPRRRRGGGLKAGFTPYLLLAPALAVIAGLLLYPVYQLLLMSTQKVGLRQIRGAPAESVGTDNYTRILESDVFWSSLRNTLLFAVVTVALTLVIGTLVGLLIHRLGRVLSTVVITSIMLAWATPQVNVAVLFRWMFDENSGVVNWLLNTLPDWFTGPVLGRSDWSEHTWFLDTGSIYFVLVTCVVWQSFPFIAISVLAGLKSIPGELHEAARVDGAGAWWTFWKITFPLLRPVFAVLLVLSIIWDFKVFTQLYVLLGGAGGRDAWNLSLYAYNEAFSTPPNMGLGSAIAVVLTVILLLITCVYVRQIVRQEEL